MVRAVLVMSVLVVVVEGRESRQCTNSQMETLWSSIMSPATVCQPRLVTVAMTDTVEGHSLVAPTHVSVRRCSGSCSHSHSLHSCLPGKLSRREVEVVLSPVSAESGLQQSVCGRVTVEEHESCACRCDVSPGQCSALQTFLPLECRCVCSNRQERLDCLAGARHWDPHHCVCLCPGRPYPTCPNGYIYDYLQTCSCTPTKQDAFTELQLVLVVLVVSLVCGLTSVAQCYRRKVGLFRQLRAGQVTSRTHSVIQTLNDSFDQAVARKRTGMEGLQTLEEDIELLSIKR